MRGRAHPSGEELDDDRDRLRLSFERCLSRLLSLDRDRDREEDLSRRFLWCLSLLPDGEADLECDRRRRGLGERLRGDLERRRGWSSGECERDRERDLRLWSCLCLCVSLALCLLELSGLSIGCDWPIGLEIVVG